MDYLHQFDWGLAVSLPAILSDDDDHIDQAARLLAEYYSKRPDGRQRWTGSRFNSWAGGGDAPAVVNTLTADDLVAVSFLGIDIPGEAALELLETHSQEVSSLLVAIPSDLDLSAVATNDVHSTLEEGSPALELWHLVRGAKTGRWGIGETAASKIMARKRPRLIPIYDSVVGPLMGLSRDSRDQWVIWHRALTDGAGLPHRLQEIHRRSNISDPISDIRVMDIVLWMHGKSARPDGSSGQV